jgi:hypothetical protein
VVALATYVSCFRAIASFARPKPIFGQHIAITAVPLQTRTYEAIPEFRIWLKVLAMVDHCRSEVPDWEQLVTIVRFFALCHGLDVEIHGLLKLVHTLVPQIHLLFQRPEFFGRRCHHLLRAQLFVHLLAKAIEFPTSNLHFGGFLFDSLRISRLVSLIFWPLRRVDTFRVRAEVK